MEFDPRGPKVLRLAFLHLRSSFSNETAVRSDVSLSWERFSVRLVTVSPDNRPHVGWVGVLMISLPSWAARSLLSSICFHCRAAFRHRRHP